MKIGLVVEHFPALTETFILRQITGLIRRGHEVRIFSDKRPPPGDPVHSDVRSYRLLERTRYLEPPPGDWRTKAADASLLARLSLTRPSVLRLLTRPRASAYGGRRVLLSRLHAVTWLAGSDVVHCHFGHIGLRYRFLADALGAPLVTSFYGHDFSRIPQRTSGDVYTPLFEDAFRVLVLGDFVRDRVAGLGCAPDRIETLHIGVDPADHPFEAREPPPAGEPIRLLSVARLVEKKGLEFAIRAMARLSSEYSDLRYEVIGGGPLRDSLIRLATEEGLGDRIRFLGARPQSEVRRAMREAHIFLQPSVTASDGDQEGTPTVLMEASASGLPVVATRHAGIPEIVLDGKTGFLVQERDVEALAGRIEHLLRHPGLWESLGRAGRRHVEAEYDVRRLNDQLEAVYEEAVGGASGRPLRRAPAAGTP